MAVIKQITDTIEQVEGVRLLDVDPGRATNRTVVTFVGTPEAVVEAAFLAIGKAALLIDMRKHQGEHPRMGATDVCPLIPVANITMDEVAGWARRLGERVGRELEIPVYLYEEAASCPERRNLASIRAGEYEGLAAKLASSEWAPDFGPSTFNARAGATVIGARDFLVAYNVNLNTTSVRRANSVAFDVREKGRVRREGDPITGKIVTDEQGQPVREAGVCEGVKAIGWFIEEYGLAQISMNITNLQKTPLHVAFEACRQSATRRGLRVTGSELVGLVPLSVLLDAGRYYLRQQRRSLGVSEAELIHIAVKSLGLDELRPFDPQQKIIEYRLREKDEAPLLAMDLRAFANETASESVAPGGGSVSAYLGALGAALATMVANISSHKRGWDQRWEEFSGVAVRGEELKDALLALVDEDTRAFNAILAAFRLPKATAEEKEERRHVIREATRYAIAVPFRTMELAMDSFSVIRGMVENGNPNSLTDAAVGALCARVAVRGAYLNVRVNARDLDDPPYVAEVLEKGQEMVAKAAEAEHEIMTMLEKAWNPS